MAWFDFLKASGYFHPGNNPEPMQVNDGIQIPFWQSLSYLEKLSLQIKEGNDLEYIDEIIEIIKNVSEHPRDNYHTWYVFIKILGNLPNERIPKEIFQYIPIWLGGKFDTMLQSVELCEKLLPKFLNDSPTEEDIEKAEQIIQNLFAIERPSITQEGIWNGEIYSYRSRIYLHYLSDSIIEKGLAAKIVQYCSDRLILELATSIKKLLLEYPRGINSRIIDAEKEYEIKTMIDGSDLIMSSKLKGSESINGYSVLRCFEELTEEELKKQVVETIKVQGINYLPTDNNEDAFQGINFATHNDLNSLGGFHPIEKLGGKYYNSKDILEVFSLIFRELLIQEAKQQVEGVPSLLKTICINQEYNLPFFKRVALYVMSENWGKTKSLFWQLLREDDPHFIFTKHQYQKELYRLLNKIQHLFNKEEKQNIQAILYTGPQGDKEVRDEKYVEYWQLRWYSALRDTEPFKEKYLKFSNSLNINNEHYENLGEITTRIGSLSPFTVEEVLQKSNHEIVSFIHSFEPPGHWDEPSTEGLAESIGKAVEAEPEQFSNEIDLYANAHYLYIYFILNGFREAWLNKRTFNWQKVLAFCSSYITKEGFYSGDLKLQDDRLSVTHTWVVGSIANLLTEGLQNDKNVFELELLTIAKDILIVLVNHLKPVEDFRETNMDYPTYSLNSTAGKVLRTLLDYSLRIARNKVNNESSGGWETVMKALFMESLEKGILDGYILEGMYFRQFYFLDKTWITDQVKNNYNLEGEAWLAFLGGFAFGNAPFNKHLYQIFYPHYERAISNHVELKGFQNNGLIRHLVAFYFWGYEDLSQEGLLLKFLNTASPTSIQEMVNFIWRQEDYLNSLNEKEKQRLRTLIYEFWNFLESKYQNPQNEEEQKILSGLINFIAFVAELDETISRLIIKSCLQIRQHFVTYDLFKNLMELKDKGIPSKTAKHIGEIILSVPFNQFIPHFDAQHLKELVTFLFLNGQNEVAITICNRISSRGQDFLKETYNSFNT